MRKLFFFSVVIVALFFVFVSVGAKKANAQILGPSAIVSGYLDNTTGTIPITVTISFYSGSAGSPVLLPAPNPKVYVVPVGQRVSASYTDTIDRGWYEISWGTSCTDPPVSTSNAVVPGAYIFASQDVHCITPNATPSITNTACANFGWNLTGVGPNGSNISSFEVFMSTNSSQVGPGDPTIGPSATLGASARSYDFGALGSGTYYVRVRAVSPQAVGSWSSVNQFTCAPVGLAPTAASGLSASRSCNGSGVITANIVNVAFTWTKSTPTPSDEQWIDYSVFNNNFGGGYANASLGTSASSYNGTGFAQGTAYYWRINNRYGTNWYPSSTGSFMTPTCPVGASPRPTSTPVVVGNGQIDITSASASCAAGGVVLNWTVSAVPVPPLKNQYIEMRKTDGTVVGQAPIPIMDNQQRTYTVIWDYWAARGFPGYNLLGSTNVWYVVGTYDNDSIGRGGIPFYSPGATITNPASCAPAVTYTITASGNSNCIDGINPKVHLTWTSNTDNTTYTIYKDGVAQSPTVGGAGRSWDSGPETAGQLHSWIVRGTGGVAGTVNSNAVAITTATCSSPPLNASGLTIINVCNGANPEVRFQWADNATNETGYWLDVNTAPWTGPTSPSPWGVKTLGVNATSWLWSSNVVAGVSGPMDFGIPTVPAKSTEYYWRVRAFNASRQSDHVYPPFGTVPPGTPFKTLNCGAVDLQVRFDDTTWQGSAGSVDPLIMRFQPSDTVKVNVLVTNAATSPLDSPATDLDIYYLGSSGTPDCQAGTSVATAPGDAIGAPQRYPVPLILKGDTATISVTFKIGTGGGTVYAFAAPKCNFSPASWTTMSASKSYLVKADGFFETKGGDVGVAKDKKIRVGFDSSTIPAPGKKYQSDYVIAAGTIESNVHSKPPGWMLNSYSAKQVPTNGVYQYYKDKFLDQAMLNQTCGNFNKPPISYCNGSFTFNTGGASPKTAPTVDQVIFVDDDLKIESDLILTGDTTLIFIVKGKIIVNKSVTKIHGVFITKEGFADINDDVDADGGVGSLGFLEVYGAVYVDDDDEGLNLKRYFTTADNIVKPSVKFIFEPKYLAKESVRNMIGVKSIKWTEVAP